MINTRARSAWPILASALLLAGCPDNTPPETPTPRLSGLTVSAGTLTPVFEAETFDYSATVPSTTSSITLTASTETPGAFVTVNDLPAAIGGPSDPVSLSGASTLITVAVSVGEESAPYEVTIYTSSPTYVFSSRWGSDVSSDGSMHYPNGIAVDSDRDVYVADPCNRRILKYSSAGEFLLTWGTRGSDDGEFQWPGMVAVDASKNVYVSDAGTRRIQQFASDGTFVMGFGSPGSGDGQFVWAWGVAVDSDTGMIYVADPGNNRIQKFNSSGGYVGQWGWGPSTGDGEFDLPTVP